jgi:O-antigen/teichoic acid export membrane protein
MSAKTLTTRLPLMVQPGVARLLGSPVGHRLANGVAWNLAGAMIARGLAVLASILTARMLGYEAFGELGVIQSTVGTLGVFAGFGLGLTATKHVAEFRLLDPARAGRVVCLAELAATISGGTMMLALFALAPWLATCTLAAPHLGGLLQVAALVMCVNAINGVESGALAGLEAFKAIARVNLLSGVLTFAGLTVGVGLAGLPGAVWGLAGSSAANCLFTAVTLRVEAARAGIPIRLAGCRQEWRVIGGFSLLAFIGSLVVSPVNWICSALLVNQPGGYGAMGLYTAATQWRTAILFLPGTLGAVALPMMASYKGAGDERSFRRVLGLSVVLNGGVALALAFVLVLGSKLVLAAYGKAFEQGQFVFVVVALSGAIIAVNNALSRTLASQGDMKADCAFHLAWGLSCLGLGMVLIPRFGADGLAVATLLAALLQGTCQWAYLFRRRFGTSADGQATREVLQS